MDLSDLLNITTFSNLENQTNTQIITKFCFYFTITFLLTLTLKNRRKK